MSYRHLTLEERYVIAHLQMHELSLREIARRLERDHSTIARELKRNGPPNGANWPYWYDSAQVRCQARKARARHCRRLQQAALCQYVEQGLRAHWSPETISGRIRLDYPSDARMRISHEQIYRWVYRDTLMGGQLYGCLRLAHRRRRKQRRYASLRGLIPGRVSIGERAQIVAQRRRFGDWEGDTVYGAKTRACLLTQLERKSRYLLAHKLADRTASSVARCEIEQFSRLPAFWRRTLTVDNGKEFADFGQVEQATGLRIYFADPYSAWQRGANENANGLLRRYFPKGTDFSTVSDEALAAVVQALNNRPRKCLGYRTPHEVVQLALSGALGS